MPVFLFRLAGLLKIVEYAPASRDACLCGHIMLKNAVAYYHELLNDPELAAASQKLLDEGLESSKLIFGGRRLTQMGLES